MHLHPCQDLYHGVNHTDYLLLLLVRADCHHQSNRCPAVSSFPTIGKEKFVLFLSSYRHRFLFG